MIEIYRAFETLINSLPIGQLWDFPELIRTAVEHELITEPQADALSQLLADRSAYIDVGDLFD